jgi:HAD superfamily hydrolase (TIGR01509 family)
MTQWVRKYGIEADPKQLAAEKNVHFIAMLEDRLDAMPGAERLLIELLKDNALLGLVSHSPRVNVDAAISYLEWDSVFQVRIGNEDVQKHKPDPEGFLLAADKLGVKPERCLVFEDSPAGIRAGKAAGMRVVGVRNRSVDLGPDALAEADLVVERLDQITPADLDRLAQL